MTAQPGLSDVWRQMPSFDEAVRAPRGLGELRDLLIFLGVTLPNEDWLVSEINKWRKEVDELSARDLHEVRWRAFLAGFDARNTSSPLGEVFKRWCEHERHARLDELRDLGR